MTLHLAPSEIEKRIVDNVAMYENTKWPNATSRMLVDHWRDCLEKFKAYQRGEIGLKQLPSDIREMGWSMPTWGTYGT